MWRHSQGLIALALLAACGGPAAKPCLEGEALTAEECAAIAQIPLGDLPAARGNRFGDSEPAAVLGFELFYDARLSRGLDTRCATCHMPEREFADGKPVQDLRGRLLRNSPTLLNVARSPAQFWDGRADSLWAQAMGPLENPLEMNFTRLELAHRMQQTFRAQYEAAFGAMPDVSDPARFPAQGKPGDPAWESMAPADRETVNQIAANVGKAFDAYQRKIAAGPSRVDRFLRGDASKLSAQEKHGLAVLARAKCLSCHSGPLLSDEGYHNLGVPAWPGDPIDQGRAAAVSEVDFSAAGPFWDGPAPAPVPAIEAPLGAFRTPSLRNLSHSAPYGHNGRFASLDEAISFHLGGGGRGQGGFTGEVDPGLQPQALSDADRQALLALLLALDGDYPPPPWNNWPQN